MVARVGCAGDVAEDGHMNGVIPSTDGRRHVQEGSRDGQTCFKSHRVGKEG